MTSKRSTNTDQAAAAEWPLSPAATLGSYTRVKGIEREIRANLPWAMRKHVKAEAGRIALSIPGNPLNFKTSRRKSPRR